MPSHTHNYLFHEYPNNVYTGGAAIVFHYGVWDYDGFYDLQTDPHERHNLINVPAYQKQIETMRKQLFDELETSGGLDIPVVRPAGERLDQRKNTR